MSRVNRNKRARFIVRSFAIVFIVFLFWQVWLITMTIYDLLRGISDDISFHPKNLSRPKIPPIIHQLWKTSNLSNYPITTSHAIWKKIYPDYTIRLWTDVDLEQLFSSKEYSYLLKIYQSYPFDIQRADLARLVVLHSQGGIYADLDVFPRDRSIEKLRSSGATFIIPRTSTDSSLTNHFLASEQHSNIINYFLRHVPSNSFYRRILLIPYLEVFSKGSIFLTRIFRQWIKSSFHHEDKLWILSSKQMTSYINHDAGRSWHSFDGYLINLIDQQPILIIYIFICFFLLTFFFYLIVLFLSFKYQRQISVVIRFIREI